ncbi:MAG: hypothetical protein J6X84_05380 [Treponema sp.]|nr:hypothetical protein [Treponema sp.]
MAPLFCESGKWTIGAQKFTYTRGQKTGNVEDKIAQTLPSAILENLNRAMQRNVMPDEKLERTRYKLRLERQSLYLQLSSEYKKRDSLILNHYSDSKLKSAIQAEEKKIQEIQTKIDENLQKLKTETQIAEEKMKLLESGEDNPLEKGELSEREKFKSLFKNIFIKDESLISLEQVAFYKNDITNLFTASKEAQQEGAGSAVYEREAYAAGLNALVCGSITSYADYISVTAELYLYPGSKLCGQVTEIGSISELELLSSSLANQLLPCLTNAMPVELLLEISPKEAAQNCKIYIDDILQNSNARTIVLDSGVHNIQFISENYRTAGTSYYFEGNKKYGVSVNFEELHSGVIQVDLRNPLLGDIYMNGEKAINVEQGKSQISINGNAILGEFIAENGETSFFYIPKNKVCDQNVVTIKAKPMDRMSYIDSRRKWMYGAWSAFMISLIPAFYTYGNYVNNANLYNKGQIDYNTANSWQMASNVTRVIAIGCGLFWGYELVRYLIAANSVLPQNAKAGDLADFVNY